MSDERDREVGRSTRRPREASSARARDTRAASGRTPPPRRRRRLRFRDVLLAGLIAAIAVAAFGWYLLSAPEAAPDPVEFEVQPGWGARRVAAELEAQGLIRDDAAFSLWLRLRGIDRKIGEGAYDLSPHLGAVEIGRRLAGGGRPRTVKLVVPEGLRMEDVAARLEAAGIGDAGATLERMRAPGELRPAFVPVDRSLEGYLFPASYEVEAGAGVDAVIDRLVDRFRDEVGPEEADLLVDLGLRVHEWVTLASMVQAEAANDAEMPLIAGVFLNRLDRGMMLQSDPTVAYGLGKRLPELDAVAGDLRQDHPWNTYTRAGLPAGPIGNPGTAALQAVLKPSRANAEGRAWLYFLHGSDGEEPVFRPNTSLEAHERDIDLYLR